MELAGFHGHFDGVSICLLTQTVIDWWIEMMLKYCHIVFFYWRGVKKVSLKCYRWCPFFCLSYFFLPFCLMTHLLCFLHWSETPLVFSLWELKVSIRHSAASPTTPTPHSHSSDLSSSCHLALPVIHLFLSQSAGFCNIQFKAQHPSIDIASLSRSYNRFTCLYLSKRTQKSSSLCKNHHHRAKNIIIVWSRGPSVCVFNLPPHISM